MIEVEGRGEVDIVDERASRDARVLEHLGVLETPMFLVRALEALQYLYLAYHR